MASYSRDSRSAVRAHRRDSSSSSHNTSRQRPRLLRSSATEPSITASNAIRGSLAGPGSPQKATDLLNRVVVYSPPPEQSSAPEPIPHHQAQSMVICRDHREHSPSGSPGSQDVVLVDSPSGMSTGSYFNHPVPAWTELTIDQGYYFSFPSFEEWNRDKQEDIDRDSGD
ncbi:hypothetical protein FDECE_15245 [Fusarium decemcellulare]|uniref:Uncharacterized protein n=1 Tax=Fusarium decemcellulare TaxID=57161 RepID=A0ACC1S4M6_9HYPO|nr:hypothetical protein FDECE_15245 [Fusarium decemcellulare]KAJ3531930.1 hypothetical protein NM208_g8660 [Fusarium decemcellulare]